MQNHKGLDNYWMPFTANAGFKARPRMLESASGMYYRDDRGNRLLDSCAGLYSHAAGHGHPKIVEAVERQLGKLDYGMAFQFGHSGAFELAAKVAGLTPDGINKVFFTNSGSEAVETALKIALRYHAARGEAQRTRFVGREKGYHGVNFGGLSVGGIARNKSGFGPALPNVHHMRNAYLPESRFTKGQPAEGVEFADDLQSIIDIYGGDTIAACIVEPIVGSGGIYVPPVGYLRRLRDICDANGILLIFDEVICGFGRTGSAFGATKYGVTPDMMTLAKALTNGTIPMGAVACDEDVFQAISAGASERDIEMFHGYTYSGHPVACAAGIAALDVYEEEGLFERARDMSDRFLEIVFSLKELNIVRDIRGDGLLAGVDLEPDGAAGKRGYELMCNAFDAGLVLRTSGDTFVLAPALVAEEDHLVEMVSIVRKALSQ